MRGYQLFFQTEGATDSLMRGAFTLLKAFKPSSTPTATAVSEELNASVQLNCKTVIKALILSSNFFDLPDRQQKPLSCTTYISRTQG